MPELLLVSGLGRCGTSLSMQMLAAAGYPIFAPDRSTWPDFELSETLNPPPAWPGVDASGALKWLDPHRVTPPKVPRAIFLVRQLEQQAKSQLKMVQWIEPATDTSRSAVRALARSLAKEEFRAKVRLQQKCERVLTVRFEALIETSRETFARVWEFIGREADTAALERAVACVRERRSACLPYMLEERLAGEVSA
jgi:hypothetical protein